MVSPGGAKAVVRVTVRRCDPVTVSRADDRRLIVERPTAKQTNIPCMDIFHNIYTVIIYPFLARPGYVTTTSTTRGWVLAPFKLVPEHVEQPEIVRQQAAACPGVVPAVGLIPGIFSQQVD